MQKILLVNLSVYRVIWQHGKIRRIKPSTISFQHLILFLIIVVLTIQINAQNQKISIEHLGIEEGMSYDLVVSLCQDQKGFLWFFNQDGLDRYDGYSFTTFKYPLNTKMIGQALAGTIAEDKEGNIWLASMNGGIEKFDTEKQTFMNYIPDTSKPKTDFANSVYEVFIDRNDVIWLGTGNGLYKFNKENETFTAFRYDEKDSFSLGHNAVNGIYEDKSGILWIATGGGLDRYDRDENKFYHYWHYPNNPWSDPITNIHWLQQIIEDGDSLLWIGSDGGLIKFDKKSEECTLFHRDKSTREGRRKSVILSLCDDNTGRIWLGTIAGIDFFDKRTSTFVNFRPEERELEKLNNKVIQTLLFDKSGLLWIDGSGDGVYKVKFPDPSFKNYVQNLENGKESLDGVHIFLEEEDGNVGMVYTTELNYRLDLKKNIILDNYIFRNIRDVWKVMDDLWVFPSAGGLYKLDIKENNWECYLDSLNTTYSPWFRCIGRGKEENIWLGSIPGELISLNLKTKEFKSIIQIKDNIITIYQDSFGLVWFGGFSTGLFCYDPEKKSITEYTSDPNDSTTIIDDSFYSYCEDKNGTLWLGCLNGIVRYNRSENNFSRFYGNNGFMYDMVYLILEDDNGNLWISTINGITKFNPATGQFKDYYSNKYFPDITFWRLVGYKAKNGELYFGGGNGYVRFNPDSIKDDTFIPPIAITGFKKFDKYYPFGEEIELEYDDNFLTFEFAALSYLNSEENQYAYMMEGVDRDWVYCETRRYAYYPNLTPGEYIFKVKGSDCNRVWNEAGTSIEVIIFPPWWKTTGAYIFYVLLIISIIYITWKLQLKRIRIKHDYEMSKFEAEKMHEVDEMKSRFFANISHEFRTPLTLIVGPAEKIISKSSDEDITKEASFIKRNSKRLLKLVNQLLDLSRLDSGKLKLEASISNIVTFIKGAALSFESLSESKDIMLKIKSSSDLIEVYFDREKMMDIMSNLLSNAFKFTPERGNISITIEERSNNTVEIKIRNTGPGITKKELPKLFDRFYQVDSSQTKEYEGTGIGLALTKELVELHHGSIRVDSEVDNWTEFTLNLPLGRGHLKDEEIITTDETIDQKEIPVEEEEYLTSSVSTAKETIIDEDKTTILVVEDNYDMREYIIESLSENYLVEEAVNGEQGVRIAERIIPDLIISDLMMPKMDGNELTRILKNDERTSHIPIIILTAKSGQENKIEGLQTGADDYLTKPFDLRELRVRVENLIDIRKKLQEKFSKGEFISKPPKKKLRTLDEKFLTKVIEVIEKHISEEEFSIEECSSEVGMSRTHFHKKMRALVGKSPSQYVRTVRLYRAKQMIEEQRGNISEIAYSVGFSSPQYFSKCFKEEFGYPPSEILS